MKNKKLKSLISDASELFHSGDFSKSKILCHEALRIDPDNSRMLHLLSILYLQSNQVSEALEFALKAKKNNPKDLSINNSLALSYRANGDLYKSLKILKNIIDDKDNKTEFIEEIYANIGLVNYDMGNYYEALEYFEKTLDINHVHHTALVNKGNTLRQLCLPEESFKVYKKALEFGISPETVNKNIINLINYSPDASLDEIYNYTSNYWNTKNKEEIQINPEVKKNNIKNKINVGYISPDFREHTIGYFFKHLLQNTDKERFNILLYYNHTIYDNLTKELESNCHKLRSIFNKPKRDIINQIKNDNIDILIDLAGHTDGNNLDIFRYKPAPVQATWLGYYATTGLNEIDYIISDKYVLPEKYEYLYTEKPLRLNYSYLCFEPPDIKIPIKKEIKKNNNSIIFGCLNNVQKINENLIRAWSEILNRVENSYLLIKSPELSNIDIKDSLQSLLIKNGISTEKIILYGRTSREDHLKTYEHIDIALDTFPFNGGMTTAEALWMGVPTIVIEGDRWVSRVGASILYSTGLDKFICQNINEYVEKSIYLSSQTEELQMLHRTLRSILTSSPFCNAKTFVKDLEEKLILKWEEYINTSENK